MPRSLQFVFSLVVAVLLVGGPLWYKREHERHYRNFRMVHEGVLYRSGQLDLAGLKRIVHDYGIKTIVSLRDREDAADQQEAEWASKVGINHVRIPQRAWSAADGTVPAAQGLATFNEVMSDPANRPVLIHCFAGIHRTGAYCAVYRMDYDGWTNREAIAEMRAMGYATLDDDLDVLGFLERYQRRRGTRAGHNVHRAPRFFPPPRAFLRIPEIDELERAAAEQAAQPTSRQIAPAP